LKLPARSRVNDTVASLTACTGSFGAMTTNVGLNLIVGRPAREARSVPCATSKLVRICLYIVAYDVLVAEESYALPSPHLSFTAGRTTAPDRWRAD
jgi:hypothetical protein